MCEINVHALLCACSYKKENNAEGASTAQLVRQVCDSMRDGEVHRMMGHCLFGAVDKRCDQGEVGGC